MGNTFFYIDSNPVWTILFEWRKNRLWQHIHVQYSLLYAHVPLISALITSPWIFCLNTPIFFSSLVFSLSSPNPSLSSPSPPPSVFPSGQVTDSSWSERWLWPHADVLWLWLEVFDPGPESGGLAGLEQPRGAGPLQPGGAAGEQTPRAVCFVPASRRGKMLSKAALTCMYKCIHAYRDHVGESSSVYHAFPVLPSSRWDLRLSWVSLYKINNSIFVRHAGNISY